MALYFECRINKKRTPSDCFFGDFAQWASSVLAKKDLNICLFMR